MLRQKHRTLYTKNQKENIMKNLIIVIFALLLAFGQTAWAESGTRPKNGKGRGHEKNEFKKEMMEFHKEQKQVRKAFKETLKEASPEERHAAMQNFSEQQHQKRVDFSEGIHEERLTKLKTRLNNDENLSAEKKQEIIAEAETRYEEKKAEHEQRYKEKQQYIQNVHDDDALTPEEKKAKIKKHMEECKEDWGKKHRKRQKNRRQNRKQE